MFRTWLTVQDAGLGESGAVLSTVKALGSHRSYAALFCAMAYASRKGAADLANAMKGRSWENSDKRWLVGIDFGTTEPAALQYLSRLPGSTVRVPNGSVVVARPGFMPEQTFHPKSLVFYDRSGTPTALVVGSANLTRNGLSSGTEMSVAYQWPRTLSTLEKRILTQCKPGIVLLEKLWQAATPLDEVLGEYERLWRTRARSRRSAEDDVTTSKERPDLAGAIIHGIEAVLVASARALWTAPGGISRNRGPSSPGSQLDLPRGSRVFFGFSPEVVPKNTTLGSVLFQVPGYPQVTRTVRFGNNYMDKINLPVPGSAAPPGGYHQQNLLFTRLDPDPTTGRQRFLVELLGDRRLAIERSHASGEVLLDLSGSRRKVGLLF
jgi:hypothetical protein